MWHLSLSDIKDPIIILGKITKCTLIYLNHYIKLKVFNNARFLESSSLWFIVHRPISKLGFDLIG